MHLSRDRMIGSRFEHFYCCLIPDGRSVGQERDVIPTRDIALIAGTPKFP